MGPILACSDPFPAFPPALVYPCRCVGRSQRSPRAALRFTEDKRTEKDEEVKSPLGPEGSCSGDRAGEGRKGWAQPRGRKELVGADALGQAAGRGGSRTDCSSSFKNKAGRGDGVVIEKEKEMNKVILQISNQNATEAGEPGRDTHLGSENAVGNPRSRAGLPGCLVLGFRSRGAGGNVSLMAARVTCNNPGQTEFV